MSPMRAPDAGWSLLREPSRRRRSPRAGMMPAMSQHSPMVRDLQDRDHHPNPVCALLAEWCHDVGHATRGRVVAKMRVQPGFSGQLWIECSLASVGNPMVSWVVVEVTAAVGSGFPALVTDYVTKSREDADDISDHGEHLDESSLRGFLAEIGHSDALERMLADIVFFHRRRWQDPRSLDLDVRAYEVAVVLMSEGDDPDTAVAQADAGRRTSYRHWVATVPREGDTFALVVGKGGTAIDGVVAHVAHRVGNGDHVVFVLVQRRAAKTATLVAKSS